MYDVCIIGAGTSGLMASIAASAYGAHVLVIDKNKRPGKKLRLTGGGRCNVTNLRPVDDLIEHIPGNGKFLHSAFSQFDNQDIIHFFEEHNVSLKEEDHGRMFPESNSSRTIVDTLTNVALSQNVEFQMQARVTNILTRDNQVTGILLQDQTKIQCSHVIIATGGMTYTYTGSNGDGYRLAKKLGHHVTELYPTESPLVSEDSFIKNRNLQGISLRDVQLSVIDEQNKIQTQHRLDLLFTHFGISGPCALRCSMTINQLLKKQKKVTVLLNSKPDWTMQDFKLFLTSIHEKAKQKSVKNALQSILPERFLCFTLEKADIDPNQPFKQVTQSQWKKWIQQIQQLPIHITKTWPMEKSFVTGGGIELKEVNPKTMESKLISGLYFSGEVLDINGYTGGFNITAAFSTGYVAGIHAAMGW